MTSTFEVATSWIAGIATPGARLLAGPSGRECLDEHRCRLGYLPDWTDAFEDPIDTIARSGLTGRGGGHFPLARKLLAARNATGTPIIVVNATESEPASRKDRALLELRPHLIIDGARAAGAAVGADRVIVATHEGAAGYRSIVDACAEVGQEGALVEVACVPNRYIAGESSALVSYLNGGPALPPSRTVPTAVSGVAGRPTVVSNAETVSHVALISRYGADWFRSVGSPHSPGSTLVTVTGDVNHPGSVLEILGPATIGDAISRAGGAAGPPQAVLLGGYGGTWLSASEAWGLPLDQSVLQAHGHPLGCGLIGVLGASRCGLSEAAHLLRWLAGERAGQCGACTLGLPDMVEWMQDVEGGTRWMASTVRKIVALGDTISGRGLCHLPDGAVSMVESALTVFAGETELHRKRRCSGQRGPLFPAPKAEK